MQSQSIQIRKALLTDAVTIAAFNIHMALETEKKKLDPYTVSAGVKAALQDTSKGIYLVAELEGRIVGQLMITREWSDWRNGDIWWIQSVYVHPDFRKKGIFKSLHQHAAQAAKENGAIMLRLYVEKENATAQAVYQKLGLAMTTYGVMEVHLKKD